MRIIHLITSLGGGGTENFLFQILSRSPQERKHQVFFLGNDGVNGHRIRHLGIPVEHISPGGLFRKLFQEKPDVLHTCLHWAHQVGRIMGALTRVPIILSSHRSIDVWQKPWHRVMDRWTLPLAHTVAVNSDTARRVLEKRLGGSRRRPRIVKIDNGLDFDLFQAQDRQQARRLYDIPPDAVLGGTLMRLHAEKGAEKIPEFARALLQQFPKLYLVIGGHGPLEDSLKLQTKPLGDRIRWIGWQDDAVEFLSAMDFFWLLSREESFPQALLEASGMGLPWVAPDVGDVQALRDTGAAGLVYPAPKLDQAIQITRDMMANLDTYRSKAQAAIPRIKDRYDLNRMVRAFYKILV